MDDRYPIPIHKILQGASAVAYLPFALNQLWRLRRIRGDGYFVKHYSLGGYTIRIAQNPFYAVVRIQAAGSAYFEFQTTGYPIILGTGSYANEPLAATIAVSVNAGSGGLQATLLGNQRVPNTIVTGPLDRSQQIQLANEPCHYPGPKTAGVYPRSLFQSWAPGSAHTGVHITSYHNEMWPYGKNSYRTAVVPHNTRDITYDVGWADAQAANPVRYAYLNSPADWPRAAGIQTVTDPLYGTREFAIYVDAFDQVSVFPTSTIVDPVMVDGSGNPIQNVLGTNVQYARVTFPSGVYQKSQTFQSYYNTYGTTGLNQFPEYDWKLRHDGTKMCGVVYYQQPATFDATYYTTALATAVSDGGGTGLFYPTAMTFNQTNQLLQGVLSQFDDIDDSLVQNQTYTQNATGLLEIDIGITLTGANPEDFTLALNTNVIRDPNAQGYCTLFAGYVWHDVPNPNGGLLANQGDLCVLDVECYGNRDVGASVSLLSVKDLTTDTELMTFGAEDQGSLIADAQPNTFTSPARILAVDFPTLSFAIQHTYEYFSVDTHTDITSYSDHFGIGIYVMGTQRSVLWPTTINAAAQAQIELCLAQNGRALVNTYPGGLQFMPLNDFTTWTDAGFAKLRQNYIIDTTLGVQTPQTYSLGNPYIEYLGFKIYDTLVANPPAPTDTYNWFYYCLPAGLTPAWPLFDITAPIPGWYQYTGQVTARVMTNPNTTFFAHPNGTWAFWNQEFFYNAGGAGYKTIGDSRTSTVPLDLGNFEHCIFDRIELRGKVSISTSFVNCWNLAVTSGHPTDNSAVIPSYDTLRAATGIGTYTDPSEGTVTYQTLQINWQGYAAELRDYAYFTGTKTRSGGLFDQPNWVYRPDGAFANASLGTYWISGASYVSPQTQIEVVAGGPGVVTFSSCVMVSA